MGVTEPTPYYTSAFPDHHISEKIGDIFESIKRITVTGRYRIFYFEDSLLTQDQIPHADLQKISSRHLTQDQSVAGTAVSIAQTYRSTILLTCAHVVQFPDTTVEYYSTENLTRSQYVKSIGIKLQQRNILLDLPHLTSFDIEAVNKRDDLALIRFSRQDEPELKAPPLSIKLGNSKDLKWGSFIYVAGYPKGYPVITRGIVSSPNRTTRGDFVTDALFNPGMSGGVVLASRDLFSSFEWVGIANSVSAQHEYVLVPNPGNPLGDELTAPYLDIPYVERKTRLNYGITQSIPTADINDFLNANRELIQNSETSIPDF